MNTNTFPKNFYWGTATAAHQIEGNLDNDWTTWERKISKELAVKSEERFKAQAKYTGKMPDFEKVAPGHTDPMNYISGRAVDHFNRWEEDVNLMSQLGHNSYRFSIEWSRVEPSPGIYSKEGIEFYRKLLIALKERGITPFVTLWHATSPNWFSKEGAWLSKYSSNYFAGFVQKIVTELGEYVDYWITLNEPVVNILAGYAFDSYPPQHKNLFKAYIAKNNMIRAHIKAYHIIKDRYPESQVGTAKGTIDFDGEPNPLNTVLNDVFKWASNYIMLERTIDYQDFIGVNHYIYLYTKWIPNGEEQNLPTSDFGWYIRPQSIYNILKTMHDKFKKPIIITENGIATHDDNQRIEYIKNYVSKVGEAIKDGIDVRGYLHWSLLDNFEWDKGYWPKFGLVSVDRNTMERTIKPSAWAYKRLIEQASG